MPGEPSSDSNSTLNMFKRFISGNPESVTKFLLHKKATIAPSSTHKVTALEVLKQIDSDIDEQRSNQLAEKLALINPLLMIQIKLLLKNLEVNDDWIAENLNKIASTPMLLEIGYIIIPINKYINKTPNSQYLFPFRKGATKCLLLTLISAFSSELSQVESLNIRDKVIILTKLLAFFKEHPIWSNGQEGKETLSFCINNADYIDHVLNMDKDTSQEELRLVELFFDISDCIAKYRAYVNSQITPYPECRKGYSNLNTFDQFLKEINTIVQDTNKSILERLNDAESKYMQDLNFSIGQSAKTSQEIYEHISSVKNKYLTMNTSSAATLGG